MSKFQKISVGYKPDGQPITAKVYLFNGKVTFRVDYLEEVKKDNPEFSKDGIIAFVVDQVKYQDARYKIKNYLYTLMLKEVDNYIEKEQQENASGNPSNVSKSNTRRTSGTSAGGKKKPIKGKRQTDGLHDSARGAEPAENIGRGTESPSLAESGNSEVSASEELD